MTSDDKLKCAKLYQWATTNETEPDDWNEAAADKLAELYAEISKCSLAMRFIPKPPGSRPGWMWLVQYVYQAVSTIALGNERQIFEACQLTRVTQFKTAIAHAMAMGY